MGQDDIKNIGLDLDEFLDFFLQDSQEQIEKLGSGLLQLEKDGDNIGLINELFRSAHSLKGASGTMGFTPIVELTHSAEDLLDRVRQGKIGVTNEIIDILLSVTDQLKLMLAEVEERKEITEDYSELVQEMKKAIESGQASAGFSPSEINTEQKFDTWEQKKFVFTPKEKEILDEALFTGKPILQIDVQLAPNTLMKAVRAVMVIQKLEPLGKVVKIAPTIEELEADSADRFSLLLISNEPPEEIQEDVMEIAEIFEAKIFHYAFSDSPGDPPQPTQPKSDSEPPAASNTYQKAQDQETSDQVLHISKGTQAEVASAVLPQQLQSAADSPDTGNTQVHTIRVDTARMDNLINLVGEMVITRTRLVKIGDDLKQQYQADNLVSSLNETNIYLGRLMSDLQESVMRLRMVPVGTVFNRYPRLVRDFCRKTGKKIDLLIHGEETELDKTVIELIGDPLTHLIRNSVDHGIEPSQERTAKGKPENGTITLDAYHEGNHIAIIVRDDGAGLDLDKIYNKALAKGLVSDKEELSERDIANLIFLPGFSTAEQVTDISGRGVGMDVVKKALNSLGGLIDIETQKDKGTSFIIRLPLTLAIIQALLVEVAKETYAVPLSSVVETLLIKTAEIKTVGGIEMVQVRGNTLPLISLRDKFDLEMPDELKDEVYVVVVGLGDKAVGLVVDELHGQQEIVIKSLGEYLNNLPGIAGATILGDGQVTLILDIGSLIQDIMAKRNK